MRELENLKELYLEEIKKINKKGELTPPDAEAAKKALEAIEKIDEICCCTEDIEKGYSERGYSNRRMSMSYDDGRYSQRRMPEMYSEAYPMMHYPYYDDGAGHYSDRRGRSMTTGRYISRHDGINETVDSMISKLEHMKSDAPDRDTMMAIDNVIRKLEAY